MASRGTSDGSLNDVDQQPMQNQHNSYSKPIPSLVVDEAVGLSSEKQSGNPSDTRTSMNNSSESEQVPQRDNLANGQTQDTDHLPIGKHTDRNSITDFFKRSRHTQDSVRKFWKSGRSVTAISSQDLSEDDVVIALMGPTGTGKSSFINKATGFNGGIGHELQSCTTEIGIIKVHFFEKCDFDIVFVDTPGFDDTNKSDGEILEMIAQWLKTTYERNIKLSGILYLHRISDNRMAGTPLKNLRMFKKLCGKNALQNIILTTTMWDEVQGNEGDQRETELRKKYWNAMISQGSTVARYQNTAESAWEIVEPLLRDANTRSAVRLQQEMVDMKRQLPETGAGRELYDKLEILFHKQQETLRRIRAETARPENEHVLGDLKAEYDELQQKIAVTITDMRQLKLPLGKRLIRLLLSPLGAIRSRREV